MKKTLIKICAPVMAVCMLAACGSDTTETIPTADGLFGETPETTVVETTVETTAETTLEETKAVETANPVIGTESDSSVFVHLMNTTTEDIVAVAIKVNDGEYSNNLISTPFAVNEDRIFYYDNSSDASDAEYTVKITFKSGTEDELHNFSFVDYVGADICFEDGQVFLKYKDLLGDVSTYDAEVAIDAPKTTTATTTATPTTAPTAATTAAPTVAPTEAPTEATSPDAGCIDDGLFY